MCCYISDCNISFPLAWKVKYPSFPKYNVNVSVSYGLDLMSWFSKGEDHWNLWTALLWSSEAAQSDQALACLQILLPSCSQKWHGCKVRQHLQCNLLYCILPGVHFLCYCFLPFAVTIFCTCICFSLSLLSYPLSSILCCLSLSLSALPSEFSEVVDLFTSCSVPLPPFPPELEKAGVTWLCLKWQRPTSSPKEDDIFYILEMEEEGSVCLSLSFFDRWNKIWIEMHRWL